MQPIEKKTMPGSANEKVIELFKRWLERAEQGKLSWAAVCVSEHPTHNIVDYAGAAELTYAGYWGLDILKDKVRIDLMARYEITKTDLSEGSQIVQYDMSQGPACFDFVAWLVVSEMNRRRAGAPAPLKVSFTMSITSEAERELHKQARQKFIDNVCRRVLPMVGAEEFEGVADAPMHKRFTFAAICEYHKRGEEVPLLKPSDDAMRAVRDYLCGEPEERSGYVYQPPVTITLREVDYWRHRNSNLPEWIKFAHYLEAQGERVIFVRDTAKAEEPIEDFEICPSAALDIDVRQALYEVSKCNFFVSNGPWTMAVFGTRPYLMFVELSAMSPFHPETPQFWRQWHGIDEHEQLPWAKDFQRIIWKRDDFKNLVEAWEQYGPRLEHHVAA